MELNFSTCRKVPRLPVFASRSPFVLSEMGVGRLKSKHLMNRRHSFLKIAVGFFGSIGAFAISTCKLMADHFSSYSWPSYPQESSLRKHLLGKPHYMTKAEIAQLSFEQCRQIHDDQHKRQGGKPPHCSRLWMNKTYKKPKPTKVAPAPKPPIKTPEPTVQQPPVIIEKIDKTLPDERYRL